jgi:hypothetical protein
MEEIVDSVILLNVIWNTGYTTCENWILFQVMNNVQSLCVYIGYSNLMGPWAEYMLKIKDYS